MATETPLDPDRHIKVAGAGIVTGLVIASLLISVHWWPGVYAAVFVELLLIVWVVRDVRKDFRDHV
jgi:predicted Co/Zn/Cd cation transporter (cation efflux family)